LATVAGSAGGGYAAASDADRAMAGSLPQSRCRGDTHARSHGARDHIVCRTRKLTATRWRLLIRWLLALLRQLGVLSFRAEARETKGGETARVLYAAWRRGSMAARGARAAGRQGAER